MNTSNLLIFAMCHGSLKTQQIMYCDLLRKQMVEHLPNNINTAGDDEHSDGLWYILKLLVKCENAKEVSTIFEKIITKYSEE